MEVNKSVVLHFPRDAAAVDKPLGRKEIAAVGEEIALRYFTELEHSLVDRNWRSGQFAEIDLILRAADGMWVFVEVKTRRIWSDIAGFLDYGFDAIHWRKRRKILISVRRYLETHRIANARARIDAVIVTYHRMVAEGDRIAVHRPRVIHVPEAFTEV